MGRLWNASATFTPPEPAFTLMQAMVRAAADLRALPLWLEKYPPSVASPVGRQVLWAFIRRVTGNPDVAFAIADRVPPRAAGSLWELYECAPSLRALHAAHADWARTLLLDIAQPEVVDSENVAWVRYLMPAHVRTDRAEEDFRSALQVRTWRVLLAQPTLAPSCVCFTYPRPLSTRVHVAALGPCELRFAQPCFQVGLPLHIMDAPLPTSNPERFDVLQREALCRAGSQTERPLADRAEENIITAIGTSPSVAEVAVWLSVSERTLRRKLADAGVSFRSLLARARERELALHREANVLPMREVARELGFANVGALRNAMRRGNRQA